MKIKNKRIHANKLRMFHFVWSCRRRSLTIIIENNDGDAGGYRNGNNLWSRKHAQLACALTSARIPSATLRILCFPIHAAQIMIFLLSQHNAFPISHRCNFQIALPSPAEVRYLTLISSQPAADRCTLRHSINCIGECVRRRGANVQCLYEVKIEESSYCTKIEFSPMDICDSDGRRGRLKRKCGKSS